MSVRNLNSKDTILVNIAPKKTAGRMWDRLQRSRIVIYAYDVLNKLCYGYDAPVKFQRLYWDPGAITLDGRSSFKRIYAVTPAEISNVIAGGDWDLSARRLEKLLKFAISKEKVVSGKTWHEVGEYTYMRKDIARKGTSHGCSTEKDLDRRYSILDDLIEEVSATRRLRPHSEVVQGAFREAGGIGVLISRDGEM